MFPVPVFQDKNENSIFLIELLLTFSIRQLSLDHHVEFKEGLSAEY